MTSPPEREGASAGFAVVLPLPGEAHAAALPPKAGSRGHAVRSPGAAPRKPTRIEADVPVGRLAGTHRAAHDPPRKPADVPVSEPDGSAAHEFLVAEPAIEPVWPTPGRARRSVPVGLVHVQNLGDVEGRRTVFVMALHITRVATRAGDLYGISATKEWGSTLNGRWLAVGDVKGAEMTSHAKTWWRLGNPENNWDLLWDIVAHDQYFSIRSASTAITRGGWLYAALPEVDHGHRRVLTWTQEGHPSDDADMRWSLSTEGGKPQAKAKSESRSISIADVNRWKGISDPKSCPKGGKDGAGDTFSV